MIDFTVLFISLNVFCVLILFSRVSIGTSRRERASNALLRCGIARALVDDCLCDADHIDVSQAAIRLLLRWGGDPSDGVARAFFDDSDADSVASSIVAQRAKPCSDVVLMRMYELVVLLYTRSDFAARRCDAHSATASLLAAMTSTLTSDDILLKLNVVELISQLCTSREGVRYCERSGVLRQFVDAIGEPEDPFARMYSTLVVKCIGRFVPLDTYDGVEGELGRHAVIQRLASLFTSATDPDLLTEACTALASLMANIDSAYAVLLTNTVHHYILPLIVAHNRVLGTAALYAFGTLVRRLEGEELSENFVNMCTIDNDPFLVVLQTRVLRNNENSKTPLRMAAFACLQAIASKTWGTAALVNDATWFEFLVSRDSELNMAGWHAKYELVRTVEEQLVHASIGEPKSSTIAKYLRDGAIFTRAEPRPEVAMKS